MSTPLILTTIDGGVTYSLSLDNGGAVPAIPLPLAAIFVNVQAAALAQPTWYFDFSNVTGLASDTNSGLDATHPILTWRQFIARTGSPNAAWTVVPTLHFLSGQPNSLDPITWAPIVPNALGGFPTILGTLITKVAAGAIINGAAVVAKNRGPATGGPANGQLTAVTFSGGAVGVAAPSDMLSNLTHPSTSWVHQLVAGSEYTIKQPLSPQDPSLPPLTEVDTWAQTDTVAILTPPTVYIDLLQGPTIIVNHVALKSSASAMGIIECALLECQTLSPIDANRSRQISLFNCDVNGGQFSIDPAVPAVNLFGGGTITNPFHVGAGSAVSFDAILSTSGGPVYANQTVFTAAYLQAPLILNRGFNSTATSGSISGSPVFWGPGTIEIGGSAELSIAATSGAPQALFQLQAGALGCLTFSGVGQGLTLDISVDPNVLHGPRNLTAVLLDTTIAGGGFRQGAAPAPICARGTQLQGCIRTGIN